jgi:hypothetical protein
VESTALFGLWLQPGSRAATIAIGHPKVGILVAHAKRFRILGRRDLTDRRSFLWTGRLWRSRCRISFT